MDQTIAPLALVIAAGLGIVAVIWILRRQRLDDQAAGQERPYAVSTEGQQRCPACGFGSLVNDRNCSSCGKALPG